MCDEIAHDRWLGMTETVNGLLDIAHSKYIVSSGDQIHQNILYVIGILKLIDHDFRKLHAVIVSDLLMLLQDRERITFHIVKIHALLLFLFHQKAFLIGACQFT